MTKHAFLKPFASRLRKGEAMLGTWVQMPNPEACELAALSGFDFVVIDLEHGSFSWDMAFNMIRAVQAGGSSPVVRIPGGGSPEHLQSALDGGAAGVIVPSVSSGDEAARAVRTSHFPPAGSRGVCPRIRANGHGAIPWEDYRRWADEEIAVFALIETPEAIHDLKSILASGIDGIVLGRVDLTAHLQGLDASDDEARSRSELLLEEAASLAIVQKIACLPVLQADSEHDLSASLMAWRQRGVSAMTIGSDRYLLGQRYRSFLGVATDPGVIAP